MWSPSRPETLPRCSIHGVALPIHMFPTTALTWQRLSRKLLQINTIRQFAKQCPFAPSWVLSLLGVSTSGMSIDDESTEPTSLQGILAYPLDESRFPSSHRTAVVPENRLSPITVQPVPAEGTPAPTDTGLRGDPPVTAGALPDEWRHTPALPRSTQSCSAPVGVRPVEPNFSITNTVSFDNGGAYRPYASNHAISSPGHQPPNTALEA